MQCKNEDWVCQALDKLGVGGFAGRSIEFVVHGPLRILLILLLAMIVSRVGTRVVSRSVRSLGRSPLREPSPRAALRAHTLAGVAASLVRIVVSIVAALLVLDQLGVNLAPILAGASIVGVAVGFGAQSLVRDFLSGFFILAEDQFGVGDVVTLSDTTGTVEEVNLRVTRLRSLDGTTWFVPNGEIRRVGNAAKDWSRAIVDVLVPSSVDLAQATDAVRQAVSALAGDPEWESSMLERPEVLGVESFSVDGATVRTMVKTTPAARAPLARALRAAIDAKLRQLARPETGQPTSSE